MRHSLTGSIVAAGLLLLAPIVQGHDVRQVARDANALASHATAPCSTLGLGALRGAYAFSGTAWQDLSEINPALPKGYAPVTIIGTFTINGNGDLTGWASINAGGVQMAAQFVNSRFGAPRADCSVPISLSMRINEEFGGVVLGPYPYVGVVAGDRPAPEVLFMMLGTGPGAHVELNHAKRISMHFD